ncbi:hypothetical protein [Heyndrickxia camelliae]|uniref:DUF4320 family protein n=1 Tax=Heyndrickxia camelliae TaxID=1707093 RepID=A0A2N3LEJ3_9BACI|nr:hypothetical protein [Heyndrickxia camelliae]PKR83052.1 hypothetical protein CWO92_21180 [Heyndrickxia camelliae]
MYQEDAVGEFNNQMHLMIITFFLISLTIFIIQHTQTVDMKNYVDGQIEKYGGLTSQSRNNIKNYSEKYYDGRYEVTSLSGYEKKSYGETIDYEITGKIKIFFFNLPDQLVKTRGSTVSLVR